MAVKLRSLGKTEIRISPIGLGVTQFGGSRGPFASMFPSLKEEVRDLIVRTALEGGINWFDTAAVYGGGRSEKHLVESLQAAGAAGSQVVVATKWSPFFRFAGDITRSFPVREANLSPYTVDLFQVQSPWSLSRPEREMQEMAKLVRAGRIRAVGVCNFNPGQMRRAWKALNDLDLPLASNQVQYNLLDREIESNGILDTARELGLTLISWSPLASGLLTGKFHQHPELLGKMPAVRRRWLESQLGASQPVIQVLNEIAREHSSEPAQVALSWLIHSQGDLVAAIPDASRAGHVEESIGAMKLQLTSEESARLDAVSRDIRRP